MKFDLSNIPKVFHNGQEVKGIYLNGVLAWTGESGGGGSEEVTYVNVAWQDLATDDEIIIVFENENDLTYWAVSNYKYSNGSIAIESIGLEKDEFDRPIVKNTSENFSWIVEYNSSTSVRFKSKYDELYLVKSKYSNTEVMTDNSTTYANWFSQSGRLQNASNNQYMYINTTKQNVLLSNFMPSVGGKVYFFKRIYTP